MRAKTEQQEKARRLRGEGRTYDEIQAGLGVSKSSISLWVRDLPKPPRKARAYTGKERLSVAMARREEERAMTKAGARAEMGGLSERDLFVAGVALYWAEGSKDKEYERRERVRFINSDPQVIRLYLAWLRFLGVTQDRLRLRVSIHESADLAVAECYWADVAGVATDFLQRATLKKHNPKTTRRNTGVGCHGCLSVSVLGGADLYRRIEGWWSGMVVDVEPGTP